MRIINLTDPRRGRAGGGREMIHGVRLGKTVATAKGLVVVVVTAGGRRWRGMETLAGHGGRRATMSELAVYC
jgi:hypothetical protein